MCAGSNVVHKRILFEVLICFRCSSARWQIAVVRSLRAYCGIYHLVATMYATTVLLLSALFYCRNSRVRGTHMECPRQLFRQLISAGIILVTLVARRWHIVCTNTARDSIVLSGLIVVALGTLTVPWCAWIYHSIRLCIAGLMHFSMRYVSTQQY